MSNVALNLAGLNLSDLKNEVETGVDVLVKAIEVAQKFEFLVPALAPALNVALPALQAFESVLEKV